MMNEDGWKVEDDLQAWLDGEVDGAAADRIRAAVAADPALQERVEELRALDRLLGEADEEETLSPAFSRRVLEAARRESAVRWRRPWVAGLAAALLLAVIMIVWQPFGGERGTPADAELDEYYVLVGPPEPDEELEDLVNAIEEVDAELLPLD